MTFGTLYGIGVGPGDPDLITVRAVKILRQVSVVFAASSTKNTYSLAKGIVSTHLKKGALVHILGFPMTRDREVLEGAWKENARRVVDVLEKGKNAAFITLGDPLTYSTFGYLMQIIREHYPEIPIEVVPGITSYHAGAAAAALTLAEAEESFTVISGALGPEKLKELVSHTDNVVMLKAYKRFDEIKETLTHLELGERSVLISRCGLKDEEISRASRYAGKSHPPYLSLLIIKKRKS